jgi:hypothetical protein
LEFCFLKLEVDRPTRLRILLVAVACFTCSASAQSPVTVAISAQSPGFAIPADFGGLSFEMGSELANRNGVSGYLFCATNTQLITLFQNAGIHSLRLGGGSVDQTSVPIPRPADIDNCFAFVKQVGNLGVVYSLRLLNGDPGNDSTTPGDSYLANYIWQNYRSQLVAFAIGNEPDWNSYHTSDPNITNYPSYLNDWRNFAATIRSYVPAALFVGPDTGAYDTTTYYHGQSWTQHFADDEKTSGIIAVITQHYYAGASPGSISAQGAIDAMLSASWATTNYPWLYSNNLAPVLADGLPYRLTESNDYLGGVTNASNAFASALWALDYMHWWAAHSCSGVNFHNKSWLVTDTVYLDANGGYQINPKAYALKAFDLGGHGFVLPVALTNNNGVNLTAYAVGASNELFVTIINKEHNAGARDAAVTIVPAGFAPGTAVAMFLTASNSNVGATSGVTLGGAGITNNASWAGQWTALSTATNGQCTLTVPAASAAVVKIDAAPKKISIRTIGSDQAQLTWISGALQSASSVLGPYTLVPGATSPCTIPITNAQCFYRLR